MRSPHQGPSVSAGLPGGVELAGEMSPHLYVGTCRYGGASKQARFPHGTRAPPALHHPVSGERIKEARHTSLWLPTLYRGMVRQVSHLTMVTYTLYRGNDAPSVTPHYGYLHSVQGEWCAKCHTSLWLPTLCTEGMVRQVSHLTMVTYTLYGGNGAPSVTPHYGYLHSVCTWGMVHQVSHLTMVTYTLYRGNGAPSVTPHYGYLHSVRGEWCAKCHTSLWLPTLCTGGMVRQVSHLTMVTYTLYGGNGAPSVTPHYGYLHSVRGEWCAKCHTSLWLPTLCTGGMVHQVSHLTMVTYTLYGGNGAPSVTPHYGYLHSVQGEWCTKCYTSLCVYSHENTHQSQHDI